jgi:hypothetical protein
MRLDPRLFRQLRFNERSGIELLHDLPDLLDLSRGQDNQVPRLCHAEAGAGNLKLTGDALDLRAGKPAATLLRASSPMTSPGRRPRRS